MKMDLQYVKAVVTVPLVVGGILTGAALFAVAELIYRAAGAVR